MYFEKQWYLTNNVKIISNEFNWDEKWNAIWYDKRVIHVFNKDETVLKDFLEAVCESPMKGYIREKQVVWSEATGNDKVFGVAY